MQKIDFVKNLEIIVEKLKSEKISSLFENGFKAPAVPYSYEYINPYLFESKSNYEQLKFNEQYSLILSSLNSEDLYKDNILAQIATYLKHTVATQVIPHSYIIDFFTFHKSLLKTLKVSKDILLNEILSEGYDESLDKGIILFQIIIETQGIPTEKYLKIFNSINELIETISKIEDEFDQKSEIVLLDSGSDTNVGVKTGVETAKSLFLVFKEIWDYIINFRHYKQSVTNKTLLESLSIREEIQKKVDLGVISEKEGMEYAHMIKTRTDDLIGMKVMPKQIVIESTEIQNKKLLSEFEGYKMLAQGE